MKSHRTTCLGMNLPEHIGDAIQEHLPQGCRLRNQSVNASLELLGAESSQETPGIIFVTNSIWENLSQQHLEYLSAPRSWQFVLVIDQPTLDVLDYMAQGHFLTVLTNPVNTAKITRILEQAEEVTVLYRDIYMMAKEISLDRELLARKNEQLSFLNQILTTASQSLEPTAILSACAKDLNLLLEVSGLFGICWNLDNEQLYAELFLPNNLSKELQDKWINHLLGSTKRFSTVDIQGYQVSFLDNTVDLISPELTQIITLPLLRDNQSFGVLVVCSKEAQTLGQDRLQVLKAATHHLSLAIHNGLEYSKVKTKADHDGLTHIANRQHFDEKLREELKRHQRHQQNLSLLMLDLDYFKSINDTFGHLAGDMVLREIGVILSQTLREFDFPARYGGEEFVVILPQTCEEQAWGLAERIRTIVAQKVFHFQGKQFRITVSIGIAEFKPGALTPAEMLIHEADQALYQAKLNGRNMVCCSALEDQNMICDAGNGA